MERGSGMRQKLELVDAASKKPLTDDARKLLDMAGCEDMENTWGSELLEPVDAIMQAAGLRDFHPWEQ